MSVRNGRAFLAIPGPTTVPDAVLAAMHRPAIDLYSGTHLDLTAGLLADLPKLFRTRGQAYIYAANGHGAWEAALANVLSRGDTILILESGRFATGWGEMASAMGVAAEVLPCDWHSAVDPHKVEDRLRADTTGAIKAVLAGNRYAPGAWDELGASCSMMERRADDASRDVTNWLKCYFMRDRVDEMFTGTVSSVVPFGLFVTLDEVFVDGLLHISELGRDYFHHDPARHTITGERGGQVFRLADRIRVKVARVDLETTRIDFVLPEGEPVPAKGH